MGTGVSFSFSLFLNEHGGAPGAVTPPAPTLSAQNTIGTLFAASDGSEEVRSAARSANPREIAACGVLPGFRRADRTQGQGPELRPRAGRRSLDSDLRRAALLCDAEVEGRA